MRTMRAVSSSVLRSRTEKNVSRTCGGLSSPLTSTGSPPLTSASSVQRSRGGAKDDEWIGVCDNTNSDLSISSPSFHHSNTPLNPLSRGETPLPIVSDALVHNTKGYVVKD